MSNAPISSPRKNSHIFFSEQNHRIEGGIETIIVEDRNGRRDKGNYFGPMDENGKPYSLDDRGNRRYPPNVDSYRYVGPREEFRDMGRHPRLNNRLESIR